MCKDQPRDEKTGRFQSGPPNATAFKKVMPDIYKAYLKQVSSRRFTISA